MKMLKNQIQSIYCSNKISIIENGILLAQNIQIPNVFYAYTIVVVVAYSCNDLCIN